MGNTFKDWLGQSVTVKFIVIGLLTLALLIPSLMISELIREREQTRDEAIREVSSKWGNNQTLVGPVLTVPYRTWVKKSDGEVTFKTQHAHFLPERLSIDGVVNPEIRYRGIYKVILYESKITFSGDFIRPDFKTLGIDSGQVLWEQAFVSVGIPDMRGIQEDIKIGFDGKEYGVSPGLTSRDVMESGVAARIALPNDPARSSYTFNFSLNLNGSESLSFVPVGKTTSVKVHSTWNTPHFDGAFLPDERKIDDNGFTATWSVLHLNRNFPQQWLDDEYDVSDWAFGVTLLFPVDQYQKSNRASKYAIMFIGLTFLVFFFTEVLNRMRVHPIQYLFIGFALCIFYVLLISLAEHLGFGMSYLVAALAIIVLLTAYAASILKKRKLVATVGLVLIALYSYLYTILQLEDYSLLIGSIVLFIVMAVMMYLSRNVDWHKPIGKGDE